jgi:hypothetical protein
MHPMKRFAAALFTLFVVSSLASVASAEIPPLLREGTRKMWAAGALGPLVGVRNGRLTGNAGPFGSVEIEVEPPGQFGFYQTFGLHFSGPAGPAIAFDLQEGFGDDALTFIMMPKFVYDIRIIPGLGLYLSPMAGLGFALISPDCPAGAECDSLKGATFQTAFEGKLLLGDRGMVFFRPFQLEFLFMDWPDADQMVTLVRYGLMFGGGVTF